MPSPLFPVFLDLAGRRVLLVGGGVVARRKAEALLEAGADKFRVQDLQSLQLTRQNGSRANQRVVLGTLANLPEHALAENMRTPALVILGKVAALATDLHWFGNPPIDASSRQATPALSSPSPTTAALTLAA